MDPPLLVQSLVALLNVRIQSAKEFGLSLPQHPVQVFFNRGVHCAQIRCPASHIVWPDWTFSPSPLVVAIEVFIVGVVEGAEKDVLPNFDGKGQIA